MGDPRFHEVLREMGELHDRKQNDYGSTADPFANVRSSQEFGVSPWVGAMIRLNDKITRLKQFARRGSLANESAEDSLIDIANYAAIALVLYREESQDPSGMPVPGITAPLGPFEISPETDETGPCCNWDAGTSVPHDRNCPTRKGPLDGGL